MIYQLTGNEKKFLAIKALILLKQDAVPCHRVLLRDRQLLSLMWSTANLNRFTAGPLRDAMLMKEDTVGSPPPSPQGLADCKADGKVEGTCAPCFVAELLEAKATSDSKRPFLPGYSFISVSKCYLYFIFFTWDLSYLSAH